MATNNHSPRQQPGKLRCFRNIIVQILALILLALLNIGIFYMFISSTGIGYHSMQAALDLMLALVADIVVIPVAAQEIAKNYRTIHTSSPNK